ncbi:MAG: hypothetical protein DRP76_00195 [Candidatus Omnitrophota bacterium]|nr:MAG: hypothetical protein DRP76_00195 [Candidatus Omnitrophota bacterium]
MDQSNLSWKEYIKNLDHFPSGKAPWEKEFIKAVLENVPKGEVKKVLEVGCSNGRFLRWFHKQYNCVCFGIDNDSTGFRQDGEIEFKLADARSLPYKDSSFDLVFSLGLIEHFPKEERYILLKEQSRVLKKGRYLICQVPLLSFSLNFLYTKLVYDFRKGIRHFRVTEREIKNYLLGLDFQIIYNSRLVLPLETNVFEKLSRVIQVKRILATEVLIIGRKTK